MTIISPSILSADFNQLGADCRMVLDAGAQMLHYDVMDGHFVPNISFGVPVLKSLHKGMPAAFYDVHLMISHPLQYAEPFIKAGASLYNFHLECEDDIQQTIDDKNAGKTGAEEIEHEVKIFQNALDFSNTLLRDCMIPRNEIVAVSSDTDRERLRRRFTATGLSKILVYTDDIDNIIGYIHVNELFNTATEWQKCIKPVDFAPESMPANTMMRKMLAEKRSIAVIVDEFGGTGGLVTLEDLVEEIFGDFEDEHDKRRLTEVRLSDTSFKFSGRIEIEHLNETYNLDIPEDEEYQTLAGYIIFRLGALPQQGDSFDIDGLKFTILKKSATRIELVRLDFPSAAEKN